MTLTGLAIYLGVGIAFWIVVFASAARGAAWPPQEGTASGWVIPREHEPGGDMGALVLVFGLVFAPILLAVLLLVFLVAGTGEVIRRLRRRPEPSPRRGLVRFARTAR